MDKQPELKRCPFCGSNAFDPEKTSRTGKRPTWTITCMTWCCSMNRSTKRAVVTDWNSRYVSSEETNNN
jgi:hypothetical protein